MLKRLTSLVAVAAFAALAIAVPAQAAPSHGPGYPAFAHEGRYPEATPCSYRLQQSRRASWGGRTITLKYFYSGGCGSFARIDNAPRDCVALLDRSTDGGRTWSWVQETVDPGINFAYTMVGNNLSGRVSRAALACGPSAPRKVIARTSWY
jgi:hypothetical protein